VGADIFAADFKFISEKELDNGQFFSAARVQNITPSGGGRELGITSGLEPGALIIWLFGMGLFGMSIKFFRNRFCANELITKSPSAFGQLMGFLFLEPIS
jgi:hypothetical protein